MLNKKKIKQPNKKIRLNNSLIKLKRLKKQLWHKYPIFMTQTIETPVISHWPKKQKIQKTKINL